MPAKGHVKGDRLTRREKVSVTPATAEKIARAAREAGMTRSCYMRMVLEAAVGEAVDKPRRRVARFPDTLLDQVHALAMQVRKLGTNVNQLAKQANQGMVPITEAEARYMKNQHQMVLSAAAALFERVAS